MTSARLFIRNDDVWTLDREFRFFFDLAMERDIPVVHAVIPGKMDTKLIRFLCRAKEKTPHLLDIVQHGWMHTNHSLDKLTKYEFGKLRSLNVQREDIKQGLKKMQLAFGAYWTPAFVPPYHGYDSRTLQVLEQEGFQVFSAGIRRVDVKKRFIEIPELVSFSRYEHGKKSIHQAKEIIAGLAKGIHRRALSGVLTHHQDFKGLVFKKELTRFFDYIVALRNKEKWRVILFSEILSGSKARG